MFGQRSNPISAYSNIGLETSIQSATPHELILLLFQGAQSAISMAQYAIDKNDFATRGTALSKAIDIINNGLRASLDIEAGGDLATKLSALYEYMCTRLLYANLRNDAAVISEVSQLLAEIHGAWAAIGNNANNPAR